MLLRRCSTMCWCSCAENPSTAQLQLRLLLHSLVAFERHFSEATSAALPTVVEQLTKAEASPIVIMAFNCLSDGFEGHGQQVEGAEVVDDAEMLS
jgi:hypothetical protein